MIAKSIYILQKTEPMALKMNPAGFRLCFSGGKDSQCLYHVAKMAGVKFEAHYQWTTIDPPELLRFVRKQYPDVIIDQPKTTFWRLCLKKKMLPTQKMRYCCAEMKESTGAGFINLTGVRRAESAKRAACNEIEKLGHKMSITIDQFTRDKEMEVQCMQGKDKVVVNPILEWSTNDVWTFIREVAKVPYCELYDKGYKRLGCIFCPMSRAKSDELSMRDYPKYYDAYIRLIKRIDAARKKEGMSSFIDLFGSAEASFRWWRSHKSIAEFLQDEKQGKINFGEDAEQD